MQVCTAKIMHVAKSSEKYTLTSCTDMLFWTIVVDGPPQRQGLPAARKFQA